MDSFLQGRTHISNNTAQEPETTVTASEKIRETLKPENSESMTHAHVQTVYEEDVLKKIIVHCDCGKELVIAFDYKK